MTKAELYEDVVNLIQEKQSPLRPLIVGINGIDGSGKTRFSQKITNILNARGRMVCCVSIDNFHHARVNRYRRGELSPEGYYFDSFDYNTFANKTLKPAFEASSYPVSIQTKSWDLGQDISVSELCEIAEDTIIICEGVFLFRPEILPFLNLKIFLHTDFEVAFNRMKRRDLTDPVQIDKYRNRFEQKYMPGQKLYFQDIEPLNLADIVIDNNDYENPKLTVR